MNARILLIGQGLFLDGLTHILNEQPYTEIIGAVSNWGAAQEIIDNEHPDIVIIEHNEVDLYKSDLDFLLESQAASIKVIFLTLSANKMVIHNRQQLSDVSVPDLIDALQFRRDA